MIKNYDIIVVGSGLAGAMIAYKNKDKKVLVLEKNDHIGGFCYTEKWDNIDIHKYGCHIFHTNNYKVWEFVNSIVPFIPYTLNVKANYKGKIYSLPFNMNTFNQLWGVTTPEEAKRMVETNRNDIVETLVRGYTEKQWGKPLEEVNPDIINRLPFKYTWDNNYFHNGLYCGIPENGYTEFIEKLLSNAEIRLNTNYLDNKEYYNSICEKVFYTGTIDSFYNYCFGKLDYRCLHFENKILETSNFQGTSVMNYTDKEVPWTRIVEHKHFKPYVETKKTWITKEYPSEDGEPCYPVNNEHNILLYNKYKEIPNDKVSFCGRLGEYKYYDMCDIIEKYL